MLEEWVLATGAGNDLCPTGTIGVRSQCNNPCPIDTANAIAHPDSKVIVTLDALDEEDDCLELDKTIRALAIGRQ